MQLRAFLRAGHLPTLICAFLYFDISFMVWVSLGALANSIAADFDLDPAQKGFMVAVPILGGAVLRIVWGILTDRWGARRTGLLGLTLTLIPLALGWLWADSFLKLLLVGIGLGVAGASFAAALPLASRWYPPQFQGLAMGIAGAGNSGTALATLLGPVLAAGCGWQNVLGLALIPVVLTLVAFFFFAKNSPNQPTPRALAGYVAILREADTWWFCLFYAVTFGGFVGLASFLNIYFHDEHGLTRVQAGYFTTACVLAGSLLRPVGGYLADRFGGIRLLLGLYSLVAFTMLGLTAAPVLWIASGLLVLSMASLGMGNGSVFQLVPQRFTKELGVITGVVGAAGGLGGFFLPNLLGGLKQLTSSYHLGFLIFGLVSFSCVPTLLWVSKSWESSFVKQGGVAIQPGLQPSTLTA